MFSWEVIPSVAPLHVNRRYTPLEPTLYSDIQRDHLGCLTNYVAFQDQGLKDHPKQPPTWHGGVRDKGFMLCLKLGWCSKHKATPCQWSLGVMSRGWTKHWLFFLSIVSVQKIKFFLNLILLYCGSW
jgi:hypothetical protein